MVILIIKHIRISSWCKHTFKVSFILIFTKLLQYREQVSKQYVFEWVQLVDERMTEHNLACVLTVSLCLLHLSLICLQHHYFRIVQRVFERTATPGIELKLHQLF